jgi:hypothetical protein
MRDAIIQNSDQDHELVPKTVASTGHMQVTLAK